MREPCLRLLLSILLLIHLSLGIPSRSMTPGTPPEITSSSESTKNFGHQFTKAKKPHIVVILADDLVSLKAFCT